MEASEEAMNKLIAYMPTLISYSNALNQNQSGSRSVSEVYHEYCRGEGEERERDASEKPVESRHVFVVASIIYLGIGIPWNWNVAKLQFFIGLKSPHLNFCIRGVQNR